LCAKPFARGRLAVAQEKGGIVNVATIGEPPTLDPMSSTADLVGIVTQHIFETLYTFDKNWKVTPLLAEACRRSAPTAKPIRSSCAPASSSMTAQT
jgi:peptide/nickel transport system substrate-binding protein